MRMVELLKKMVQISTFFSGLARNISNGSPRKLCHFKQSDTLDSITKEARNNGLMLTSPTIIDANSSSNFTSIYSKRGQKGINQDCFVVWEEFGYQEDMLFCGVFDGHGPWGHLVSRRVRKLMPALLLRNWQSALVQNSLDEVDYDLEFESNLRLLDIWKQCFLKTCLSIDEELDQHPDIDSFYSGTTALLVVMQGDTMIVANVGDSRAVLATTSDDDGSLVPIQLSVDFKPNLPQESERIKNSGGRVSSSQDERGLYRIWLPKGECFDDGPGLAVSRALGDHFIKDFGLISEPDVIQRRITNKDHFVILATDGVWDVITNQEAIDIVASSPERQEAAKRLVKCAAGAWKRKRPGIVRDDISAICLFFHQALYYSSLTKII